MIKNSIDKSANPETGSSGMLFNKKIWRVQHVACFLGCSVGHIYRLVAKEGLPKRKRGRLLFFVPDEILNWVLEGECV